MRKAASSKAAVGGLIFYSMPACAPKPTWGIRKKALKDILSRPSTLEVPSRVELLYTVLQTVT